MKLSLLYYIFILPSALSIEDYEVGPTGVMKPAEEVYYNGEQLANQRKLKSKVWPAPKSRPGPRSTPVVNFVQRDLWKKKKKKKKKKGGWFKKKKTAKWVQPLPPPTTYTGNDWTKCFDGPNWCQVKDGQYITGMYKSGGNLLNNLEKVASSKANDDLESDSKCYWKKWNFEPGRTTWQTCYAGYYISGLRRRRWAEINAPHRIRDIIGAKCCRPVKSVPNAYVGKCVDVSMRNWNAWVSCPTKPTQMYMVGMSKLVNKGGSGLSGMDKMKCCEMIDL